MRTIFEFSAEIAKIKDCLAEQGGLETPLSREVFPKENPRNCLRNFLSRSANIVQRGEFRFQLGTMAVANLEFRCHENVAGLTAVDRDLGLR
jgi:hypothetical protein